MLLPHFLKELSEFTLIAACLHSARVSADQPVSSSLILWAGGRHLVSRGDSLLSGDWLPSLPWEQRHGGIQQDHHCRPRDTRESFHGIEKSADFHAGQMSLGESVDGPAEGTPLGHGLRCVSHVRRGRQLHPHRGHGGRGGEQR